MEEADDTMKKKIEIKKRTVVFALLSVLMFSLPGYSDSYKNEEHGPNWWDAVYLEQPVVDPANEGKLVAVSGKLTSYENAEDPVFGLHFSSAIVNRYVQRLDYDNGTKKFTWKNINEGSSTDGLERARLGGKTGIGEFIIDNTILAYNGGSTRDVMKDDLDPNEVKKLEEMGYFINSTQMWYSDIPDFDDLDRDTSHLSQRQWLDQKKYDGGFRVRWDTWDTYDSELTVVGIQQGNMIMLCPDLDAVHSRSGYMTYEQFREAGRPIGESTKATKVLEIAMGVVFLILALTSLKPRKQPENTPPAA